MNRLYTTPEVAEMLGLSVSRVKQASPLYANKIGRQWLWTEEGIAQLESRKGKVGNPNFGKKENE